MRITTWNVRGLNAPNKRCLTKRQIEKSNSDIILLQETKLEEVNDCILKVAGWEEVFSKSYGTASGLGILWCSSNIGLSIIEKEANWIMCKVASLN